MACRSALCVMVNPLGLAAEQLASRRWLGISLQGDPIASMEERTPHMSVVLTTRCTSFAAAVIKDFCKQLGADGKQVQGLIRLAKKNGEKLGFLA